MLAGSRYMPPVDDDDAGLPDYNSAMAIRRSNTGTSSRSYTTSAGSSSSSHDATHWRSPSGSSPSLVYPRRLPTPISKTSPPPRAASTPPIRTKPERYIYAYSLVAAGAPLKFIVSVEPQTGKPVPGKYIFRLSLKVHDVERQLGEPTTLRLSVDPRALDFAVFLFPGKRNVLPVNCLFSLRVWLRVNGVDHRIFGSDDLWLGQDPDFSTVEDASFAQTRTVGADAQIYDAIVGRARVQFIVRWQNLGGRLFRYTLEYDAGGAGQVLIDDLRLRVDGDPRLVNFFIYTVPIRSVPTGASHRLRVWIRSFTQRDTITPGHTTYVYQRIWKTDEFKIGGQLDFDALGPRLIMGVPVSRGPQTVAADDEQYDDVDGTPRLSSPFGYQQERNMKEMEQMLDELA
ncbi:hypothetical protein HMN09_01141300 [Mycena chlorophos]|uniref:Uncharacterized protein n=1 Tax=Mycena chlorophos TaxID=658473 RepID=A0A8H6VZR5_MYCCL|nr:hypothetical protein HMN09_01141300 [Mycena chlorophos]